MVRVNPTEANEHIRGLLNRDYPARIRLVGVLAGKLPGIIYVDDTDHANWAVLQETQFGTLFPSAGIDAAVLTELIIALRAEGEVLLGCLEGDPLPKAIPTTPDYEGRVLDCSDRDLGYSLIQFEKPLPNGFRVLPLDKALAAREQVEHAQTAEEQELAEYLDGETGVCLLHDGRIVSAATGGRAIEGVVEIGVVTLEAHQNQGYATMLAARFIAECEAQGLATYWNCNVRNTPSVRMARKLGYRREREYDIYAWSPVQAS